MSDKPELKPFSEPSSFSSDTDTSRFKLIALIGFVILVVVAIAVVIFLPGLTAKKSDQAQVASKTEPNLSDTLVNEDFALKVMEAKELLQEILKLQARLENEGVKVWGAELLVTSYNQALASLAEADTYLNDQLFDQALKSYHETIKKLKQLDASRPERLRLALHAGDEAFAKLDSELAKNHYEIALAADSANSDAQIGLQRAKNLPQVLDYIEQGQFYEGQGDVDLAKQMYNKAVLLDKDFQLAQDHLNNIDELISARDFRRSMSDAISALNKGEIEQAKRALDIAKNLQPDTAGVHDLELQVENMELSIELERLSNQALQYEQTEEWEMAIKVYDNVLKIDANAGFAQQGKLRAKETLGFNQQVQHYLSKPNDLEAPEHISHARKVYEMIVAKSDIGPKLSKNAEKLYNLIEMYTKPVTVLLQSDELTDVIIYRVGRLGRFIEHRLKLQPGNYKVLGARSGYRDVSLLLTVSVGSEAINLTVYCKEKI